MTVLVLAQLRFVDISRYRRYQANFADVFRKFKGELLVADEKPTQLEGDASIDKVVIMKFPDSDEAFRMLESSEYQQISKDREAGAITQSVLVRVLEGSV